MNKGRPEQLARITYASLKIRNLILGNYRKHTRDNENTAYEDLS